MFQDERDLALGARLDQRIELDGVAVAVGHAAEQLAEVGLVEAEQCHHGRARCADLLTNDRFAGIDPALHHALTGCGTRR